MRFLIVLVTLAGFTSAVGQILDDSTELVYGPETTLMILLDDIRLNRDIERHPDTTLYKMEAFEFMDEVEHYYQDLGNNGTALWSIFYPTDELIGRSSGMNAFVPYAREPNEITLFDTKSPYIGLEVVFGSQGRSNVELSFSRNVNENWNLGFDLYRITSDKQLGANGEGDRNVEGSIYDLYTHYSHPKKPYEIVFSVSTLNFDIAEVGGIQVTDSATNEDLFLYQDSNIQLADATAEESNTRWFLYQEYQWKKPLGFYQEFQYNTQSSRYQDFADSDVGTYNPYEDFYNQFLFDEDSTYSLAEWKELSNELGIKGTIGKVFYKGYLKYRNIDLDFLYNDPTSSQNEIFLGGYSRFDWNDKFNVEGRAHFLQTGEYYFKGSLTSDLLFGSYLTKRSIPSYIFQDFFSNHHEWSNSFGSSFTNEIKGGLSLNPGRFAIRPQVRFLTLDQFLYFDVNQIPRQANDLALMSSFGGDISLKLFTNKSLGEAFHFENEVYFTTVTGGSADFIKVPDLFYNGRFYWAGSVFKKTMGVEVGFDLHAKSTYFGMAYIPDIQQFGLEDEFQINSFFTADLFFNMKINNFRAFVKVTHLNQGAANGYFVTPYYPGVPRVIDFGARWLFFN